MYLTEPVPFEEAKAFIADKPAVTRRVFDELLPEMKARAFTISGIECFDTLANARALLAEIPAGADWEETKTKLIAEISPWVASPEAAERRAEFLARLHGFQAYAAFNHLNIEENADLFPFTQYITAQDTRVRDTHAALDGVVLPTNSPFWKRHTPPWEWGCRCDKVGLMAEDVADAKADDAGLPPEKRRVFDGADPVNRLLKDKLENESILLRGMSQVHDLRTPLEKGRPGAYEWEPGSLQMPLDDVLARYDAGTRLAFEAWAKNTPLQEKGSRSVWDWLQPPGVVPPPAPSVPEPAIAGEERPRSIDSIRAAVDALAAERPQISTPEALRAHLEQAREAVSVPAAERGSVTISTTTKSRELKARVQEGADMAARYTKAEYLPSVKLVPLRKKRAYHVRGEIHVNAKTRATVVAHEITHATEQQTPTLLQAARDFLARRGAGALPQSLRALTGFGYGRDEMAYEDEWTLRGGNVYSGKLYGTDPATARATELLTMGIERLHADPVAFRQTDPQYFDFVITTLQGL